MNFNTIKKAEIHLHLDGSISPEILYKAYSKINKINKEKFNQLISVDGTEKNLADYLKKFDIPLQMLQTQQNLEIMTRSVADGLSDENYVYSEIRFAPQLHQRNDISVQDVIEAVLEGINTRQNKNLFVGIILCIMRHRPLEQAFEIVKLAERFRGRGVVGIDIAGDEYSFPIQEFKDVFSYAKAAEIPFTIHAGEARGAESVRTAIEYGASRIGHGIRCIEDDSLVDLIAEKQILLEVCPTSNMQTSVYCDFFKEYPIERLLKKGIRIGLNCDNHTVSR